MKRLNNLIIFLLCLQQVNAQNSLDSLRLVLPVGHKGYISKILSIPKSDSGKSKLLTSDGDVNCVWDESTKKLLYAFTAKTHNGLLYSANSNLIIFVNDDTLEVRRIKDGTIYYKLNISSPDFIEDWTNETIDKIKLSDDEKSIIVIYQNLKKSIWKVNVYDIYSGMLKQSFSGQYFNNFDIWTIPNKDFLLAVVDNSILRLNYFQEIKTDEIVEFENPINSFEMIRGTDYSYIKTVNKVIVYDIIKGIKRSEFGGEYAYFKDSILVTLNQSEIIVTNVLSNEKIVSIKIKKYNYDSGEYIEPTVLFSPSIQFLSIKNGGQLYYIDIARQQITKAKVSEEFALRYVSDLGNLIIEEPVFKCLFHYDLHSKKTFELLCPHQFDGNGEVNFSTLIYEEPNFASLFIGGFRQISQVNLSRMEKICEYTPQIKTNAAVQFDPVCENIIIQGYTDIKQLPIDLTAEGKTIENVNFWSTSEPIAFNSNANLIAVPSNQYMVLIFSYPEFKFLQEIELDNIPSKVSFSKKDNYLILGGDILEFTNSKIIFSSESELSLDASETKIYEKDYKSDFVKIRDLNSLEIIAEGSLFSDKFEILDNQVFIQNDFEQFIVISKNGNMVFLDAVDSSKSFIVENWFLDKSKKVNSAQIIDSFIVLFSSEGTNHEFYFDAAHFISLSKKKWVKDFLYSELQLGNVSFSKNAKFICELNQNNSINVIDIETNEQIYEYVQLQNNNWLVKLPNSPYYMCSKDASKMLHYVTPSLKVIGFEQLDPVYNRPDIVLDSIGKYFDNEDRGMIEEYRKSWEKRINKLGLDVDKLGKGEIAVPSAEIVGADDIAYENKTGELAIGISANDAKYPLRRFNVYVNEVPLYGSAGISIAHLNKQVWDTTVSVPLSIGENKIQVSVMNALGLENFKYPTYVNYTPTQAVQAKTYYIGIGVNEFVQSAHNLKYCVKDVRDLAKAFSDQNSNTDTLLFTNQQVTKENILALKTLLFQTTVNDKVIISCSSHGLLDDSLNFYLAMYDVDFANPKARGLKYEELESLFDGIPARQKLLLLDACNSGENDQTELLKQDIAKIKDQNATPEQLAYINKAKGAVVKLEEQNTNNFKKMSELFVNVRNNTGSVIISAAGGQESALEAIEVDGKIIENGAFTYSILECLKQNEGQLLKVNTLKQYAEKRVEEITDGKQKPTSRQETMEIDWGVR